MSIQDIKIGLLSDLTSHHSDNIIGLFRAIGKEIVPFDHSLSNKQSIYNIYRTNALSKRSIYSRKLLRIYSQLFGVKDDGYEKAFAEYLSRNHFDCILAYWGINPIADIIWIKKHRFSTKVILNVMCHPLGLTRSRIFIQNTLFRLASRYVDGIIYSSQVMKAYFQQEVLRGRNLRNLVLPPYLSERYFIEERARPCELEPNIVFMGRMDWWSGQPTDNVLKELKTMMDQKIHVYHSDKTHSLPPNKYRHTYAPGSLTATIEYASQFAASLMVYNLKACRRDDRFRVTIPDRLIASIAARIPVAIPSAGYDACKEFLSDYKAVIEFDSAEELRQALSRRDYVMELRDMALENSTQYYAESTIDPLNRFLMEVSLS